MMIKSKDDRLQANILVVDDVPANLNLLSGMLKQNGYRVRPVPSGKLALKAVEHELPDLILLDINMPGMDGFEVCQKLKEDVRFRDVPVIFISALSEALDKVKAFSTGGVDYVTKPFQFPEVEARVETHLKLRRYQVNLEDLVKEKVNEISDAQISVIFALSRLAESRDKETGRHLERVQIYCKLLAEKLSREEKFAGVIDDAFIKNIFNASPLHDIGKVATPDHILLATRQLTPEEFEIMQNHTIAGAATLASVYQVYPKNTFINMGTLIARSHHEWWNGSGYPDGLKEAAIPLEARIMAIADVYDALLSKRCYKEPIPGEQCIEIIKNGSGIQFDPDVVSAFLTLTEQFDRILANMMDETEIVES